MLLLYNYSVHQENTEDAILHRRTVWGGGYTPSQQRIAVVGSEKACGSEYKKLPKYQNSSLTPCKQSYRGGSGGNEKRNKGLFHQLLYAPGTKALQAHHLL